jgi:nitroreductase
MEPHGDLVGLLLSRRSAGRVLPDRPPRELIERLLAVACAAPNHHLTQPWRFVVLAGAAREQLGEVLMEALRARLPDPESPAGRALLAKERSKLLRAPVIIVVAVRPSPDPRVLRQEEVAAGAAAAQNILLAAQALGLGAMWRTGETAYDPRVRQALGLDPNDEIVAFIYVGYPDPALPPPPRLARRAPQEVTRWWGWEG